MADVNNLLFRHGELTLTLEKSGETDQEEPESGKKDHDASSESGRRPSWVLKLREKSADLCEIQLSIRNEERANGSKVAVLTAEKVNKKDPDEISRISEGLSKIRIDRKIEAFSRKKFRRKSGRVTETWSNVYETIYIGKPSQNEVKNLSKVKYEFK